jgi:uncharacterized membrane protein YbhN (UPF0104 family)
LWATARKASIAWLAVALVIYFVNVVASSWRWHLLLGAQRVNVPLWTLVKSFLVALYFNNFLPSNIGGDFISHQRYCRESRRFQDAGHAGHPLRSRDPA